MLTARGSLQRSIRSSAGQFLKQFDAKPQKPCTIAVRHFKTNPALGTTAEIGVTHTRDSSPSILSDPAPDSRAQNISGTLNNNQDLKQIERNVRAALKRKEATPEMVLHLFQSILDSSPIDTRICTSVISWFGKNSPLPTYIMNDPKLWELAMKIGNRLGNTYRSDDLRRILKLFVMNLVADKFDLTKKECKNLVLLLLQGYGVLKDASAVKSSFEMIMTDEVLSAQIDHSKINSYALVAFANCQDHGMVEKLLQDLDVKSQLAEETLKRLVRVYGFRGDLARTQKYSNLLAERYPQNSDETMNLISHKIALRTAFESLEKIFGVRGMPLSDHNVVDVERIHISWRTLLDRLERSQKSLDQTQCNTVLEYLILANKIDPVRYSMKKAEEVLEILMPRHGVRPNYFTYLTLMRGYCTTREYVHTPQNVRLDKALNALSKLKKEGMPLVKAHIFHSLYHACLPRLQGDFIFDNFHLSSLLPYRALRGKATLDDRIFAVEKMMLDAKIPHDRHSFKVLLTCLGAGGRYIDMWNRWRTLKTLGLRRDAGIYQRVFALASLDPSQANYAITVTKLEYQREFPNAVPSWDLYLAILDCCVTAQLSSEAKETMIKMRNAAPKSIANNAKMYHPLLNASLSIPDMVSNVPALLEEMHQKGVEYDGTTWFSAISHLAVTRAEPEKIQQVFNQYTMEVFQKMGRIPIPVRDSSPCMPFPSGPYSAVDMKIIDVYISSLLDKQDLSLVIDTIRILREQTPQLRLSQKLMKGIVKLAIQEDSKEELQWMISTVLPAITKKNSPYLSWLAHLRQKYNVNL